MDPSAERMFPERESANLRFEPALLIIALAFEGAVHVFHTGSGLCLHNDVWG